MTFLKELGLILLAALLATAVLTWFSPVRADATLRVYANQINAEYDLPPGMLVAVCEQESRWRNVAGQHGEIGVCQIKPSTVAGMCPECTGNIARKFFTSGSRGPEVARIQAELARTGRYGGAIDGVFGPLTYAATVAYQKAGRIAVDGVVGPQTWRVMFGTHDPFPGQTIAEALWNPTTNIIWAARYLAWLRDNVSSTPAIMLAAYNGGPGNPVVRYAVSVERRMAREQL